jgi:hypothetical protein
LVIFDRVGGGHVGFVVGKDYANNLLVLGGNQGNAVNIKKFSLDRNPQFRLPSGYWMPLIPLPIINVAGNFSENEA